MWKIEYYSGSEWIEKSDAVFKKIHQELNGHEECLFILPNTSSNRTFISSNKKIRILYSSEVVFEGLLVGAEYSEDLLVCFAYPEAYVRMDPRIIPSGSSYTVEYIGETISNVLQAICDEAGVEKGECPSGTVSVRFIRSNCLKAAQFLADAVNKDFWADWDASLNPRFNIGTRQEHSNVPVDPLEWPKRTVDRSQKITKVIVRSVDEDGNYIEGSAGTGDKIAVFTEKGAMDIDTLNTLAQKKLDELNTESSGVTLPLKVTQGYNLYPGDTVKLNKPELGWEEEVTYRVLAVTKTIDKVKIEVEKKVKTLDKELEDFKKYEEYGIYPVTLEQTPSMENFFNKTTDDINDITDVVPAAPTFVADVKEIDTAQDFRTWIEVTSNVVENAGGYIVGYRRQTSPAEEWKHIFVDQPSSGSQVVVATPYLVPDSIYEIHVCSLSKLGRASSWAPDPDPLEVHVGHTSSYPDNSLGHNDTAPPVPAGLTSFETIDGVILEWNSVDANDLSHYKVYYGTSDPPTDVAGETARASFFWAKKNSESYRTYYFAISAVDEAGNESSKSGTVSAQPLQVGTPDIAPDAVTAEKILDGAVSDVKLASGAVTLAKFASGLRPVQIVDVLPPLPHSDYPEGAVVFLTSDNKLYRSTGTSWTAKIATSDLVGQITETQIADNAISTPKLQANAVEADKIAANAVTSEKIAANAVEAGKIAAGAVSTNELAAGAVTAEKIQAGAVDASKLTVAQIFVDGLTFTDNSPSSGYISWSSCKVYYQGDEYSISSGNTNKKYIYWQVGYSTFATSDIKPDWSDTLFLIAINENGKHKTVWNATLIHGGSIITGTITSQELVTDQAVITNQAQIGNGVIINDHVASIQADKIHMAGKVYLTNLASFGAKTAIMVEVYGRKQGEDWSKLATFLTEQLGVDEFSSSTWTCYYYIYRYYDSHFGVTFYKFRFGSNYSSRIENFQVSPSIRYLRGDTQSVNDTSGYILGSGPGGSLREPTITVESGLVTVTVELGVRIYALYAGGRTDELTDGSPICIASGSSTGYVHASGICPAGPKRIDPDSGITTITGDHIETGSIKTRHLDADAVTTRELKFDAVDSAHEPTGDGKLWYNTDVDQLRFRGVAGEVGYIPRIPITQDSAPPENLLPNPCFERDHDGDGQPDFWYFTWEDGGDGNFGLDPVNNSKGSYSAFIAQSNSSGHGAFRSPYLPVHGGKKYYASVYVKVASGTETFNPLAIEWFDKNKNYISADSMENKTIGTDFTLCELDRTAPSNARYARIYLGNRGISGKWVYFDDVVFSEIRAFGPTAGTVAGIVAISTQATPGSGWQDLYSFTVPDEEMECYCLNMLLKADTSTMSASIRIYDQTAGFYYPINDPNNNFQLMNLAFAPSGPTTSHCFCIIPRNVQNHTLKIQIRDEIGSTFTLYLTAWGHSPHYHR